MNIFSIAKEYYYNNLDGWRYDEDDFLYVFWKKGFGTEVSTFEKLTESDLIKWYEIRKIEEEKWFNFVLNGKSLNKKLIQKYYLSIEYCS